MPRFLNNTSFLAGATHLKKKRDQPRPSASFAGAPPQERRGKSSRPAAWHTHPTDRLMETPRRRRPRLRPRRAPPSRAPAHLHPSPRVGARQVLRLFLLSACCSASSGEASSSGCSRFDRRRTGTACTSGACRAAPAGSTAAGSAAAAFSTSRLVLATEPRRLGTAFGLCAHMKFRHFNASSNDRLRKRHDFFTHGLPRAVSHRAAPSRRPAPGW